ncbi:MAG: hypothetical protein JXN61_12260 [Sedimentisphaerales bacterium]|nr:hypothetical protein [Sedimentisphaerales bacterium]
MERRTCWQNCFGPGGDESFLSDGELLAINAMEDALAPLDMDTTAIRQLITRFEACYHEADKEAEYIIKAIAAGRPAKQSTARSPKRKKELQNAHRILSSWCKDPAAEPADMNIGDISATELVAFIGVPTPLKIWQVERIIDKINQAIDPNRTYHWMALDLGDYGEPGARPAGEHYKDDSALLGQTTETIIHYTEDGKPAEISLALAIDLLMPCHWDFAGSFVTILRAVGGDLYPSRPFAYCGINVNLSPLCDRLRTISKTLKAFWRPDGAPHDIDKELLSILGEPTDVKKWLTASLDKTIRLHLHI